MAEYWLLVSTDIAHTVHSWTVHTVLHISIYPLNTFNKWHSASFASIIQWRGVPFSFKKIHPCTLNLKQSSFPLHCLWMKNKIFLFYHTMAPIQVRKIKKNVSLDESSKKVENCRQFENRSCDHLCTNPGHLVCKIMCYIWVNQSSQSDAIQFCTCTRPWHDQQHHRNK